MKKLFTLQLFILLSFVVRAQDPHFSQFFASPLTLNPAFTGKFNGEVRFNGNYRNQWPTINNAFITTTGAVDFHVGQNTLPENDRCGLGAVFLTDNSAGGAVKFNYFTFSSAYHKGLDEDGNHQISGGVQATYANMFINTSLLKFEDQLTLNGFTNNSTQENFSGSTLSSNYVDVNAGILYSGSSSLKNNYYAGVSLYHINRPNQKLSASTSFTLNPRATIHAGGYLELAPSTTLHLSGIQTFQGGASETVLGTAVQFTANPEEDYPASVYVGTWVRLKDAFIPYLGLEFFDTRLGVSYDFNTSALKTASEKQGGIELSLTYIYHPNKDKPIACPKF